MTISSNTDDRLLALLREEILEKARNSLLTFTAYTFGGEGASAYQASWHHRYICRKLDDFIAGKIPRLIINLPPRHGKQIADSYPVLTTSGWKSHGELTTDDHVFHPSGVPVRVLAKSRPIACNARVHLTNGEVIDCHMNHEWRLYDRSCAKWRTLETKDLTSCFSGERCKYQLPNIEPLIFEEIELPLDPYTLGAWLGDGSRTKACITHAKTDAATVSKIVKNGYPISAVCVHGITGVITTYFSGPRPNVSGKLWTAIKHLELNKEKHIPEMYKYASVEQRLELLAGLIDTDGSVDKYGRVHFSNCNKRLINDVYELVAGLGMRPGICEAAPCLSSSGIQGKQTTYVVGFQPTRDIPTALPRKKIKRFVTQRRVGIVRVERIENGEDGRCIQVDSPDGLYLIGKELVPTHNSELVSVRLPAYILGKDPNAKIIASSYSDSLASAFNRQVQRVMESPEYGKIFPKSQLSDKPQAGGITRATRNSDTFEISGHKGIYKSAGVGTGITGFGISTGIIDDPVKNQEEANSQTYRDKVWDWYTSTFYTRLEKGGKILVTQTRWHMDDLSGRLIQQMKTDPTADQWEVISLPAVRTDFDDSIDPRRLGDSLWPNKYDKKRMEMMRSTVGPRVWASLYQQNPVPEGGGLFKDTMFSFGAMPDRFDYMFATMDTAYSEKKSADFTVCGIFGVVKDQLYWVDCFRRQMLASDVELHVEPFIRKYLVYGFRALLVEPKGHGQFLNQKWAQKGLMIPGEQIVKEFFADRRTDKVERANNVVPHLTSRKVIINEHIAQKEDILAEVLSFPAARHDDCCDVLIDALKYVYTSKFSILDVLSSLGGAIMGRS